MKLSNRNPLKTKTLGLALAGLLPLTAQAYERHDVPARLSGEVQVTHQIPGGTITVGAEWGKRPAPQPQVVVVENRKPDVVVIEKDHGRGWERAHKRNREVTIVREEPRRQVTIIKQEPARQKVVVVEKQASCAPVSVQKSGPNGSYTYYKDANQVSVQKSGPNGTYHYYEDAHQVSIQDNRDGQQRNVYVRK